MRGTTMTTPFEKKKHEEKIRLFFSKKKSSREIM